MKQKSAENKKILVWSIIAIVISTLGLVLAIGMKSNSLGESSQNYNQSQSASLGNTASGYGRVVVKHVDTEGNEIAEQVIKQGAIGTEYTTERENIDHYMSDGNEPFNKAGNYKADDTVVVYTYKLVSDALDIQTQDNVITLKVENELDNREYKLRLEQESLEGLKLTGGKFTLVDNADNTTLVKGTTVNGALTLGMINVTAEGSESYELYEDAAPRGYQKSLEEGTFSLNLVKSYNTTAKTYELSVTSTDTQFDLEEDTENDEIVVKVKNDKAKTYDLVMKQFAKSIEGEDTGKVLNARVTEEGDIVYDETEKTLQVKDSEKIVYTIRVYNEGNQDMECQTITEVLPSGLKYLSDSQINQENGWTLEEGRLITNKLVGETIEGIDPSEEKNVKYKELELEVEVSEDEADESDILTNTVSITADEREENTDNNQDSETVNLVRYPAVYDLAIKKFASKINGEDTGRNVTVSLNNLNQIEYEENNEEKTIKHGQTVTYTIRVYNEGNKALKGTKITDIVPAGFIFDENNETNQRYGWTKNENTIKTSYLESKDAIKGCKRYKAEVPSYEELEVVFTLDEDDVPEGEIELVNEVELAKAENETDDLDNTDTDEITLTRTPKTYDLALKVFASEIDEEETSRNVTVSLNDNNEIIYTENRPEKTVKDEQRVVYTIRVFNEGSGDVTGTKITDIVPAGLVYVPDSEINLEYGWALVGNNVETAYLGNKTISGANLRRSEIPSYIDVKVEFEVVEDETADDVNSIINVVRIAKAENETDESDNEDNDTLNLARSEKVYDLAIKKFASKIDGENTGRNIEVSLTNENQIKYTYTTPEKIVKEGQKIVYAIRVYNEGNQKSSVSKIVENLPDGLKFVEGSQINNENGWVKNDNKIETTILASQTINGVKTEKGEVPEYKEVFVELQATRSGLDGESHILTNTVEVEKLEKETDLEDNKAQDSVILERRPTYDLAIKKFASTINGQATGRDVTVQLNSNDEIEYTETEIEKTVKDGQRIVYTLRAFNEGNIAIQGTKITENIPAGLRYLADSEINSNYGWTIEGENITTNYLVGKSINIYNKSQIDSKNYIDVQVEFEVDEDIANENNLITNTATIEKNENEENEANNTDTDTVNLEKEIKTHDITMKKFVYSLDGKKLDKEITATVNAKGNIIYTNDNTKTTVNKGQKVIFTLRIFNVGNQQMVGKTVTDTIPEGLKYLEDSQINQKYNWNVTNGVASTNYLVGQTIDGFEKEEGQSPKYTEVQIECEVTGEGVKANEEIINTAKMEPSDDEDNPDDNEDETTLVLEPEKEKVYDLSMKKFLFSVDGKRVPSREVVAKNVNGELEFSKNNEVYKVSNNQKLVYTLRVYNVGDGEGTGRSVIEYIPDGLKFVEDSELNKSNGWKMYKQNEVGNLVEVNKAKDATVLKSDTLQNQTIAGFEIDNNELPRYKDVQVELIVNEDNITTEDRIVTNIASVEESRLEPDPTNDDDTEKVYVKEFDLNVVKYIESITIKDNDGEITKTLGLSQKGKLYKKEIDKKKVNNTEVYVTYGLKVKNIGEIAGYATEITDYIPKDFVLVDSSNMWQSKGNVVKTTALADKIIEPGDSSTIQVTFKWKLNENNLGERVNTAIISTYKNDYDAEDKTPDKDNDDKFIISIKTGTAQTIAGIVLVILMGVATGISIKLRKNSKK